MDTVDEVRIVGGNIPYHLNCKCGAGYRVLVDLTTPRMKKARLFYPPTLTVFRTSRELLTYLEPLENTDGDKLAQQVQDTMKTYDKCGLGYRNIVENIVGALKRL